MIGIQNALSILIALAAISAVNSAGGGRISSYFSTQKVIYVRVQNSAHHRNRNVHIQDVSIYQWADKETAKSGKNGKGVYSCGDPTFTDESKTAFQLDLAKCKFGKKLPLLTVRITYDYSKHRPECRYLNSRPNSHSPLCNIASFRIDLDLWKKTPDELKTIFKKKIEFLLDVGKIEDTISLVTLKDARSDGVIVKKVGVVEYAHLADANAHSHGQVVGSDKTIWNSSDPENWDSAYSTKNRSFNIDLSEYKFVNRRDPFFSIKIYYKTLHRKKGAKPRPRQLIEWDEHTSYWESEKIRYAREDYTESEEEKVVSLDVWKQSGMVRKNLFPSMPGTKWFDAEVDSNNQVTLKMH